MAKEQKQFQITFVGFTNTAFPATSVQIVRVASEIILNFFFSDASKDPAHCVTFALTSGGAKELCDKIKEFHDKSHFQSQPNNKLKGLNRVPKKSVRHNLPRRANVFNLSGINDSVNIAFGCIHPNSLKGTETNIQVPVLGEVSVSELLFLEFMEKLYSEVM